jgi:hypothetical protein
VEIYVDNVYVHHWAPEDLKFCDGCRCNDYVDCEFGKHKFTLKKSGYLDWSDEQEINTNNSPTVNPVMTYIGESSNNGNSDSDSDDEDEVEDDSSPSTLADSDFEEEDSENLREKPGEEEIELPEIKSNVLGEEVSHEKQEDEDNNEDKKRFKFTPPLIISSVGVLFLLAAAYPFIGPLFSSFLRRIKRIKRRRLRK